MIAELKLLVTLRYACFYILPYGLRFGCEHANTTDKFQGNLVPKKSTFPSGIKALADYVHGKGLKLGIYSDAG